MESIRAAAVVPPRKRLRTLSPSRTMSPSDQNGFLISVSILVVVYSIITTISVVDSAPAKFQSKPRRSRSEMGCTYNFSHYENRASIVTQEPCLNCTCQDSMLMCYLNVCPYVKALGEDCTITKQPGQCCPKVDCPSGMSDAIENSKSPSDPSASDKTKNTFVPVPVIDYEYETEAPSGDHQGCFINDKFYTDGQRLPADPTNPCETCYCVRNSSACVLQDCVLHIEGCSPVFNKRKPTCCPSRYDCSAMADQETLTTVAPGGCEHEGMMFVTGDSVPSVDKCQNCYCMPNNTVICQSQECQTPPGCTAGELQEGECCPTKFDCPTTTTIVPLEEATAVEMEDTTTTPKSASSSPELATETSSTDLGSQAITAETEQPVFFSEATTASAEETTRISDGGSREEQGRADDSSRCDVDGVVYKISETIRMKDPCLANCTCGAEGVIQCDHISCHEPQEDVSNCKVVKEDSQCCPYYDCPQDKTTPAPSLNDCVIDGKTYSHNTTVPQDDPCKSCTCLFEELVCAVEECVEDGCTLLPPTKDICCNYMCEDEEDETGTTPIPSDDVKSVSTTTIPDLEAVSEVTGSTESTTTVEASSEGAADTATASSTEPSKMTSLFLFASMENTSTESSSDVPPQESSTTHTSSELSTVESSSEVSSGSSTEALSEETTSVPPSEQTTESSTEMLEQSSTASSTGATSEAATGASSEGSTEASSEASTVASSEGSTEASSEASTEASSEGSTEASSEAFTEASTVVSSEKSTEASSETSTETSSEGSTEASSETSTEASTEASSELSGTVTTESTSEASSESTSEVSSEPATESATEAASDETSLASTETSESTPDISTEGSSLAEGSTESTNELSTSRSESTELSSEATTDSTLITSATDSSSDATSADQTTEASSEGSPEASTTSGSEQQTSFGTTASAETESDTHISSTSSEAVTSTEPGSSDSTGETETGNAKSKDGEHFY
ncbi:flocculation protein FLO11-like [Varroa destructor]|uniref:VWFC domain-containing protein n=1 Tax=Varroa destructor TaxID=109461 RepID=A0A7M7KHD2_VARDE|nr:flocculation protein FLO11-like [Varroa destructor]